MERIQVSHVYIADLCVVHIEECQNLDRNHEIWSESGPYGSVQAHILPEWMVQGLGNIWDTSRALKTLGKSKNKGIRGLGEIPPIFPYYPGLGVAIFFAPTAGPWQALGPQEELLVLGRLLALGPQEGALGSWSSGPQEELLALGPW